MLYKSVSLLKAFSCAFLLLLFIACSNDDYADEPYEIAAISEHGALANQPYENFKDGENEQDNYGHEIEPTEYFDETCIVYEGEVENGTDVAELQQEESPDTVALDELEMVDCSNNPIASVALFAEFSHVFEVFASGRVIVSYTHGYSNVCYETNSFTLLPERIFEQVEVFLTQNQLDELLFHIDNFIYEARAKTGLGDVYGYRANYSVSAIRDGASETLAHWWFADAIIFPTHLQSPERISYLLFDRFFQPEMTERLKEQLGEISPWPVIIFTNPFPRW